MKKTLLATAIAGALGVTAAAQAATVYDQDGTKLDVYGRIGLAVTGGGEKTEPGTGEAKSGGSEFVDMGTRMGLRGSQQINSDLSAYGRIEYRFDGDQRDTTADIEIRNTYLGLKSNQWGSLQAGNFDSFYLDTVSAPFDVPVNAGLEFAGGGTAGRGDSVGYISPNLEGFQVYLQGKHHTGNGQVVGESESTSSTIETAGGVVYEVDALRLALGYAEQSDEPNVGNTGEAIYGATAQYAFTPNFSARLGYETQDTNDVALNAAADAGDPDFVDQIGYDKIGIGATYAMGAWKVYGDYYNISANGVEGSTVDFDRDSWNLGTQYNVSSNFQVFAEVYESDQTTILDSDTTGSEFTDNLRDVRDNVLWTAGARYFF